VAEDSAGSGLDDGVAVGLRWGGLATSSTTVRRWTRGNVTLHHLIDPRSGAPSTGPWRTVTAAGATCVDANIAATAAVILGEPAAEWLEERGFAARLVAGDGSVALTAAWPALNGAAA
jgi:thiamine biosynthesis lipoprotein